MSQQLSLNQVVQYFITIAAGLKRINGFGYGPISDLDNESFYTKQNNLLTNTQSKSGPLYPLMWVEPITSTLREDSLLLKHNIYIVDLVEKDLTNRKDVLSDSLRTCQEIKAYIWKDFSYEIFPTNDSELEPLFYSFTDDVEGYRMELELSIDWLASVCNIPGLYPSGTTFSTGPNYYNVQSTAYMPLGGGVFTGPITGTCGYFDCFNSTSLSGNVIYLSGVSLTDTFLTINSAISSATTAVQGGLNVYTGGTVIMPTVNVSGGTFDNIAVTGPTSVSGLSANTLWVYTGGTPFLATTQQGEFNFAGGNGTLSQIAIHQDSFNRTRIIDLYNNSYSKQLLAITDNGSAGQFYMADGAFQIDTYSSHVGVGIGPSSAKFRLKGDSTTSDLLAITPFIGNGFIGYTQDVNNNPYLYLQPSAGTTTTAVITSSGSSYVLGGNFGFGTLSPQDAIHISNGTIRINDAAATYGAGKIAISDANGAISFSSSTVLGLGTAIQNGLNTYTGGTQLLPTINVSAATLDHFYVTGDSYVTGAVLTASTAVTNSIFIQSWNSVTPAIRNVLSPGTGIMWDGPDILSLHTGGFQRLLINAAGAISNGSQIVPAGFNTYFSGNTNLQALTAITASATTLSAATLYTNGFSSYTNSVSGVSFLHTSGGTPILNVNTANGRVGVNSPNSTAMFSVAGNISAGASIVANSIGGYYINTNIVLQQGPLGYNNNSIVFGNPSTAGSNTVFTPVPFGIATSGNTLRNLFTISQSNAGYGTIASTSGVTTITGTSTSFLTAFNPGDTVRVSGVYYTIASIQSDTLLTLTTTAATTQATGVYVTSTVGERFTVGANGNVRSSSNNESGFTVVNQTGGTPVFNVDTKNMINSGTSLVLTKRMYNSISGTTGSTTTTINWAQNNIFDYQISGATTFTFSNVVPGQTIIVAVRQPGGGTGFNYSFSGSTVYWPGGTTPTPTTTTGKTDVYTFVSLSASTIYGSALTNF